MDVFFIRSVRDDFFAAFHLPTVSVMGRARSAKGRFSKYDSVHNAARARAEKRKKLVQDAEEFAAGSASVSPAQESSAASDSETEFPCLGRRAVHMRGLAEGLSECQNSNCKQPLVLLDCIKEKIFGLASVLSIPCRDCKFISTIDTDTRMEIGQQRGPRPFSSNRKAALGKSITLK